MRYAIKSGIQQTKVKVVAAATGLAAITMSAAVALSGSPAFAITGGSLFGSATQQPDGVHLVSDATHPYSGIKFTLPAGTTVSSLNDLEANLTALAGTCGGGSPRFTVGTATGNIFVYVGNAPSFTSCSNGPTGNLLNTADLRVDTSQVGGTFYDTWAHAVSLVGSSAVTELNLVVDGGWLAPQAFLVTSATVNGTTYSYIPTKDSCKDNGWQSISVGSASFKNQGDCVSYFATKGHNLPSGQ